MANPTQADPDGFASPVREAVGIFRREQDLQDAIDDLLTHGFARCELSLRGADDATTDAATAGRTPEALADDPAKLLDEEVMHPHLLGRALWAPSAARVPERADQLLLLGVHRDHRLTPSQRRRRIPGDVSELRVAVGVAAPLQGLAVGLQGIRPAEAAWRV